MDKVLPDTLQTAVLVNYLILAMICMFLYFSSGIITPVFVLYGIYVWWLNKKFSTSNDFLIRHRRKCSAPIASFFSETLQGLQVIRAYRKEKIFVKRHFKHVNRSILAQFVSQAFISWAMLRMVLFSILMTIPMIAFCLIQKGKSFSSSEVGVILCFIIPIDVIAYFYFMNTDELQQRFIVFERIVQFTKIQKEKVQFGI